MIGRSESVEEVEKSRKQRLQRALLDKQMELKRLEMEERKLKRRKQ